MLIDPRNTISAMGWCYLMRQTYGEDYLRKLAGQAPKLVASTVPGAQQLAAGSAALLIPGVHSSIAPLLANKAPVADVTPSVTCGVEAVGGVAAKAPHPNAARLLLNFLMTPEGQQAQNGGSGASSVLPNIPDTPPLPSGYVSSNLKDVQAAGPQLLELLSIH
jgi:iron(III) transport system substrate-binding protein